MENSKKKMGRPTNNPLTEDIKFRLDKTTVDRLSQYCETNNVSRAEAIRHAIHLLLK